MRRQAPLSRNDHVPTLDEWVAENGLERTRQDWITHFEVYDHDKEEAESLARLCMISLRDSGKVKK